MEAVRESWTDERLDAFGEKVDWRLERLEGRMEKLETRMDEGFRELRTEMKDLRGELGAFQRSTVQFAVVYVGALATLIAGQVALFLAQV